MGLCMSGRKFGTTCCSGMHSKEGRDDCCEVIVLAPVNSCHVPLESPNKPCKLRFVAHTGVSLSSGLVRPTCRATTHTNAVHLAQQAGKDIIYFAHARKSAALDLQIDISSILCNAQGAGNGAIIWRPPDRFGGHTEHHHGRPRGYTYGGSQYLVRQLTGLQHLPC